DARIRKRSTGFARQSIEHEVSSSAVRSVTRVQPLFVVNHCRDFVSRSIFIDLLRYGSYQVFTEIEMVLFGRRLYESASDDYVSRQTAIIDCVERRVWWAIHCLAAHKDRED